jgi:hypothetical protein
VLFPSGNKLCLCRELTQLSYCVVSLSCASSGQEELDNASEQLKFRE